MAAIVKAIKKNLLIEHLCMDSINGMVLLTVVIQKCATQRQITKDVNGIVWMLFETRKSSNFRI